MAFLGKIGLILSAGMLLAGGILLGIGAANGGIDQVRVMAENGELSIGGTRFFYPHRHHSANWAVTEEIDTTVLSDWGWEKEAEYTYAEALQDEIWLENEVIEIAKKDEIEELIINGETVGGEIIICPSSDNYFQITQGDFLYEINGISLEIFLNEDRSGNIYIPESWVGQRIDISVGNGYIYTDKLQADEVDIEIGAGYMQGTSIYTSDLDLEVGAGALELDKISAEDADIDIGVGRTYIMDAEITGDLDVDCGIGELTMYLEGKEADHNYDVSFAGNLNIGNYNYNEFRNKHRKIDNDAYSNFHIECGLGSVSLYFNEEY